MNCAAVFVAAFGLDTFGYTAQSIVVAVAEENFVDNSDIDSDIEEIAVENIDSMMIENCLCY